MTSKAMGPGGGVYSHASNEAMTRASTIEMFKWNQYVVDMSGPWGNYSIIVQSHYKMGEQQALYTCATE